jgi:hypothetical protein
VIAPAARLVRAVLLATAGALAAAMPCPAQTPSPPAGTTKSEDAPAIRLGATIFTDYTVTHEPDATDVDGNRITPNAFNIARSYINVTGQISRLVAFRVTPDIARETGTGSSLAGSYTFRLKYAYAQFNLDEWTGRGSFARFGMQQTPWIDFIDSVYRYRFQGPTMEDREGILSSSDVGATFRYVFAGNYGDVHGGIYNGDNYNRIEPNDQKALMVRATVRPLPAHPMLRGLRLTGFYDLDAYVEDAERRRGILGATYEHPYVNVGANYLSASDQSRVTNPKLDGHGYSLWATPKTPAGFGWEGLLRFDHLVQEQATSTADGERNRTIAGVAYWFPRQGNVAAALLLDYEWVDNRNYAPVRADERRLALHALINF